MKTIHKHKLEITDVQTISGRIGDLVLFAGIDPLGAPCIWVETDLESPPGEYDVYVVGTGRPLPVDAEDYVGSFVQPPFVWHVYI